MEGKRIAVYLCGGIASYKVVSLVRMFIKNKAQVRVAMTKEAQKFIQPLTLATLTKHQVYTDLFAENNQDFVPHIDLADWSQAAIVAPATANIIAKMATGLADDFVSTALLASTCPKYVVPAMNEHMLLNQATQRNLARLQADGIKVLETKRGFLAEGYEGQGRMPEVEEIYAWLVQQLEVKQDLKGKRVVVTAGGTHEEIDPVRYIANRSSGKMGYALASAAAQRGAEVTLISGPSALPQPMGVKFIGIETTAELATAVKRAYPTTDVVIMAAAVADYRVKKVASQKIKKENASWHLELVKNEDILFGLGQTKRNQLLVGFAAETENLLANAQAKLTKKNLDLLVANDVARKDIGFASDSNEVTLLTKNQEPKHLKRASKQVIAGAILDEIVRLM
ncbi:phosphopantothenoylcysteine decarboxylase phosphopantothenate-cysteine ligase [Ligilactobacillus agilis DSM 20509]|uniref:Coenzyme A biosynthesis bifunctional protein CoaBC n=1 Tax=Ligilactobacillus agilis DSM 20509 TaxID=1423718 RepID=A0A0R2A805_9LACO|nr:bifunctional phosphopantothenoylcysteine decarboxylase/phosphopantothenate--cysteine ligase CoaBC [Ligilactobacillus agilis]KRM63585.1 phosphopantothenoylcysteine decarboxylase phosphopantothenate-cysteine ligase [Ligilactobacillus agilis DSM 20509]